MTPPNLRPPTPDAVPLRLEVVAQLRDSQLNICGPMTVEFTYDPSDPYALELRMWEPWAPHDVRNWTGSREMFAVAALWGVELQSLDISVSPVTVTRATPGGPIYEQACLRVCLRETVDRGDQHVFTGRSVHLDIPRSEVIPWFTTITQVVRIGQEHRHMDVDRAIDVLLGRTH